MKRTIVALGVLVMLAGACSKGVTYGDGSSCDPKDKACLAQYNKTSKSPTPKATKTRSSTPTAKATTTTTKSSQPVQTGYRPKTYTLTIKDTSGYKPDQTSVYVTDKLVIKNTDSIDHQWVVYSQKDVNKTLKSSPVLKPGQSWTWNVDIEPGTYLFRDGKVPYIQSGHFAVNPTPK